MNKFLALALSSLAALSLTGCGGSDSSSDTSSFHAPDSTATHDLSLRSVSFKDPADALDHETHIFVSETSSTGHSGHEVTLNYTLNSATENPGETTIYFFAGLADYAGDLEEGETVAVEEEEFVLGTDLLSNLTAGDSEHSITLQLPASMASGEYKIYAFVDPANTIAEYDESNNHPSSDPADEHYFLNLTVSADKRDITDLKLKSFVFDQSNISAIKASKIGDGLPTDDFFASHDLEANINVQHLANGATDENTHMTVEVQVDIDGTWLNLNIWDNELHDYVPKPTFLISADTYNYIAHLHMHIPDDVRDPILAKLAIDKTTPVNVRAVISSEAEQGVLSANNTIVKTLAFATPTKQAVRSIDQGINNSFSKSIGDAAYFLGSLSLDAQAKLNTAAAVMNAESNSDLSLKVFGKSVSLFSSTAGMNCDPNSSILTREANVEFFGATLYDNTYAIGNPTITFEKSFTKEQLLASATFVVGPIPMTVKATASGTLGMNLDLSWTNGTFSADGNPYATFAAIGSGAVNTGIAEAGVRATLTLVDDQFHVVPSMTPVLSFDKGISSLAGDLKVTNQLNMLDGSFGLFADIRTIKICKSCRRIFRKKFCASYPCGTDTASYGYNLFNMNGFKQNSTLYHQSVSY